MFPFTWPYPTI